MGSSGITDDRGSFLLAFIANPLYKGSKSLSSKKFSSILIKVQRASGSKFLELLTLSSELGAELTAALVVLFS